MTLLSNSLYPDIFKNLPDGVFLIDPVTSKILDCNESALHQVGMTRNEVLNHSILNLHKELTSQAKWDCMAHSIRTAKGFTFIGQYRHKNGSEVSVEIHSSVCILEGREYFLSIARNITLRRTPDPELYNRDAQLHLALTDSADGLWDWNLQTDEVIFSTQLKRMLGYGPHEMGASLTSWSNHIHPEDMPCVNRLRQEHIRQSHDRYVAEYRLKNRHGHYLWVHDLGRVCEYDATGQPSRMVGMVQNITDQKSSELVLKNIASHDPLTDLLNRRECDHVLALQLDLCRRLQVPMGLCFFDLDYFKTVNDQWGHAMGDKVLQKVAHVVQALVRSTDYLFRWGGDEFLLICTDTPINDLIALAEKLRHAVAQISWEEIPTMAATTCSFGIASFPEHACDVEGLFLAADSALYRAKANGRNRVERAVRNDPLLAPP